MLGLIISIFFEFGKEFIVAGGTCLGIIGGSVAQLIINSKMPDSFFAKKEKLDIMKPQGGLDAGVETESFDSEEDKAAKVPKYISDKAIKEVPVEPIKKPKPHMEEPVKRTIVVEEDDE